MAGTLTLNDVDIGREYHIFQDETGKVYAAIGYRIITAEGRDFSRSATVELTGTARTRAAALFGDIKALAKAQEVIA